MGGRADGNEPKKKMSRATWWIVGFFVIVMGWTVANRPEGGTTTTAGTNAAQASAAQAVAQDSQREQAARQDVGLAEVTCQMAAEKTANDPSSIEWIRDERQFAYSSQDKLKAVSLQPMRAKNGFGAITRTVVKCELAKTKNGWTVVRIAEAK